MSKDIILEKFFEYERWSKAIQIGVDKGINKKELRELCTEEKRKDLLLKIVRGEYEIAPPHQQKIPKDDGTMRIVYINEGIDRIFLSIANDLLFELMPEMLHKNCKSYQKGIGCGVIVQQISQQITSEYKVNKSKKIGFKADLSKYFDSVPIRFIDVIFDKVECKHGKSKIIDILRKYYHQDLCFNTQKELISHYQSLKQGCAVASWLANVLLFHIDDTISKLNGYYVRYSDDILFVGKDYNKAFDILSKDLNNMELILNPKKVEDIETDKWFKFLGFSIKGDKISLSKKRIDKFVKEIRKCTVNNYKFTYKQALNNVNDFLYKGKYSWATSVLAIINCEDDIKLLNQFVIDALRGVITKKYRKYGLVCDYTLDNSCIKLGNGNRFLVSNMNKTDKELKGFYSLDCMRNNLITNRNVYDTVVMNMM